jgi:hypothetical protein
VIVHRGQHHQAVQPDLVFAEQRHQLGRDGGEFHAALDHQRGDAEGSGHVLDRLALPDQLGEGRELVGGMHGDVEAVLRQAGDQRPVGRHDQHGHGVVVGEVALAHQQGQRFEPATTRADLVAAACALHDDEVLQHAAFLDRGREFDDAHLRGVATGARLIVLREDHLLKGTKVRGDASMMASISAFVNFIRRAPERLNEACRWA